MLSVRDLTNEKTIDVCEKVKSYSFTEDKLRYITYKYEEKIFYLWEYDFDKEESVQIGSFDGAMNIDDHLYEEALSYNFTSDKVIITRESRDYKRFYIYDIELGTLTDYNMPVEIDSLVAAENYAYAVCVKLDEETGYYAESEENGIYKIDLSDGSFKKTSYSLAVGETEIYVANDNEMYIEYVDYASQGADITVYRYDAKEDEVKKLFSKN